MHKAQTAPHVSHAAEPAPAVFFGVVAGDSDESIWRSLRRGRSVRGKRSRVGSGAAREDLQCILLPELRVLLRQVLDGGKL